MGVNRELEEWLSRSENHTKILILILILAFIFRLAGIFWGLPPFDPKQYHPDEWKVIQAASHFPDDIFERTDLRYPTATHYTIGLLVWPFGNALQDYGIDSYWLAFYVGRILSVALGTLTIYFVYRLGRELLDNRQALLAAFFFAFSVFHVSNSAWATTDSPTAFYLALFLLLVTRLRVTPSKLLAVFCGLALGMLVGTKYTGAFALIVLLSFVPNGNSPPATLQERIKGLFSNLFLWIIGLVSLSVFLITTPGIFLHWNAFLASLAFEQERIALIRYPWYVPEAWFQPASTLGTAFGWPATILSILGLATSFRSHRRVPLSWMVVLLAFGLYFWGAVKERYWIMLFPILAIYAAVGLDFIFHSRLWKYKFARISVGMILVFVAAYALFAVVARYPDSRTLAARYIETNLPAGSTLGIAYTSPKYGWGLYEYRFPKINYENYRMVDFLEMPEYIIITSDDANQIKQALRSDLLQPGYIFPEERSYLWGRSSPPSPEIFAFYDQLYFSSESPYELIWVYQPLFAFIPVEFAPPRIEIYKIKN